MEVFKVTEEFVGTRLDVFCVERCDHSRSKISSMIKNGDILINGSIGKPSMLLKLDDKIQIHQLTLPPITLEPVEMDLDIIYEDDDLLVINKPSGLVVHPGAGISQNTLVHGLLAHTALSSSDHETRPGIVHRLDKDTSGLLVVAKNDVAHAFLAEQLKDHTMHRIYQVIVSPQFPHMKAKVDAPIGRDSRDRVKMAVTEHNSKHAVSHFTKLKDFKEGSLLECRLETGRTHQIRVHCDYMGYPVLNDPLYGKSRSTSSYGQYLCAVKLEFIHPKTKELMMFSIEPDQVFLNKIKELEASNE